MKLDLVRAITQPFSGSNWPLNLLIGAGVILLGAFATSFGQIGQLIQLVSQVFVAGYAVAVAQNTLSSHRNSAMPDWFKDWQNMGIMGMNTSFGIWIWSLLAGTLVSLFEANMGAQVMIAVGGTVYLVGALVLKAVSLSVLALLCVHYAATYNIAAFIQVNAVWDRVLANPLGVVVAAAATLGALILPSLALMYVPALAGVLVYAVVKFTGYLVIANLWAQVYKS